MKRFFLLLAVLYFLGFPFEVKAHELKTIGSVGAVFHLEPNHDPVAGEAAFFFFEFKDKEGRFDPKNCECTLEVSQGDNKFFSQNLFEDNPSPSLTNASLTYVFPERNIYQVRVNAKAIDSSFDTFSLEWDVRVAKISKTLASTNEQEVEPSGNNNLLYLAGLPLGAGLGIVFLKRKK